MKVTVLLLFIINTCLAQHVALKGYVKSASKGEGIIGSTIYIQTTTEWIWMILLNDSEAFGPRQVHNMKPHGCDMQERTIVDDG